MWRMLASSLIRGPLTEPGPAPSRDALAELAATVDLAARARLGRSLSIRQVDAGSCNGCELEIHALNNPYYDIERFGFRFVASPRHADVLLVTGPVTLNMQEALRRTYDATPDPKWVVAAGDCACTGGIFAGSYACVGAVDKVVPVALRIEGCPPTPTQLLEGLLALLEMPSGRALPQPAPALATETVAATPVPAAPVAAERAVPAMAAAVEPASGPSVSTSPSAPPAAASADPATDGPEPPPAASAQTPS